MSVFSLQRILPVLLASVLGCGSVCAQEEEKADELTEAETSIVFDSVPGAYYIVEFSYDLTTWLELTDSLLVTDVTTTFIDDDAFTQTQNRVFYRVIPEQ